MSIENNNTFFAPQLFINNGIKDISFYEKMFGATELRRFSNEDGSIHVSEISIGGAIFHLHEITAKPNFFSPQQHNGTTALIGLFVPDVDSVMNNAVKTGATEIDPAKNYDYDYRQGQFKDPFGHYWLIQKKI